MPRATRLGAALTLTVQVVVMAEQFVFLFLCFYLRSRPAGRCSALREDRRVLAPLLAPLVLLVVVFLLDVVVE